MGARHVLRMRSGGTEQCCWIDKGEDMKRANLLLADDHLLVVEGLLSALRQDFNIAGVAHNGRDLIEMARQFRPDVIVTDISMPQLNGLDAARILRKEVSTSR